MNAKIEDQNSKIDFLKWLVVVILLISGIALNSHFANQSTALRLIGLLILGVITALIAIQTTQGRQFWGFAQDARIELRKVVWPTRQETVQTTLIVIMMVVITGLFLWGIDSVLLWLVGLLTGQRG